LNARERTLDTFTTLLTDKASTIFGFMKLYSYYELLPRRNNPSAGNTFFKGIFRLNF